MYLHTYGKSLKNKRLQVSYTPVTPEVEGSSPFRTAKKGLATCNQLLTDWMQVAILFVSACKSARNPSKLWDIWGHLGTFGDIFVQFLCNGYELVS